jgi:hypothetical protein
MWVDYHKALVVQKHITDPEPSWNVACNVDMQVKLCEDQSAAYVAHATALELLQRLTPCLQGWALLLLLQHGLRFDK